MVEKKSSNSNFAFLITEDMDQNSKPKRVLLSQRKAQQNFLYSFLIYCLLLIAFGDFKASGIMVPRKTLVCSEAPSSLVPEIKVKLQV